MTKGLLFSCLCAIFLFTNAVAYPAVRPIATLSIGGDYENTPSNSKNIVLLSPFFNSYLSGGHDWKTVAGLFMGGEFSLLSCFLGQLGLSYYQNQPYTLKGSVYEFGSPSFNNLAFQYSVKSQRIMLDSKFLTTYRQRFHPFITLGAGEAINRSYDYVEIPVDTTGVSTAQPFQSHTCHSFTYALGFGLDVDIDQHFRGGVAYRFVDLGATGLGPSPSQVSSQTINYSHLRVSQFLAQISYLL